MTIPETEEKVLLHVYLEQMSTELQLNSVLFDLLSRLFNSVLTHQVSSSTITNSTLFIHLILFIFREQEVVRILLQRCIHSTHSYLSCPQVIHTHVLCFLINFRYHLSIQNRIPLVCKLIPICSQSFNSIYQFDFSLFLIVCCIIFTQSLRRMSITHSLTILKPFSLYVILEVTHSHLEKQSSLCISSSFTIFRLNLQCVIDD